MEDMAVHKVEMPKSHDTAVRPAAAERNNGMPLWKKVGFILGAVALLSLALVGVGVHVGAHGEGRWYTGAVMWLAQLFQSS